MGLVYSTAAQSVTKKEIADRLDLQLKEAQLQLEEAQRKRAIADAKLAEVLKMKAVREAEELRIYQENPLFSNYLADSWDLKLPYEHVCLYFSIGGFLLNGIPSAVRVHRAWKITRTIDEGLRAKYAEKLYLTTPELPSFNSPVDRRRFIMDYARAGKFWGLYVPLFWAWNLLRARNIADEKRWMKERYDPWNR